MIYTGPSGAAREPTIHLYVSKGLNAWTIAHEALHALHYQHEDLVTMPDGTKKLMDAAAKYCAGR